MKRRRGITLIEVLVAIFIMALGLLAILTLFPLGALTMAHALQDDRAGACASAGANVCDTFGIRNDPTFDFVDAAAAGYPPAGPTSPGYPVYVDPYGTAIPMGPLGASATSPGIQRMPPSVLPPTIVEPGGASASVAARYFTLPDDVTFATNAQPDLSNVFIQRGGRYTWAYMLHRLQPSSASSLVDLTVVVYAGRATQVQGGENTYSAPVDPLGVANLQNSTAVILTWTAAQLPPNIRHGGWILDTSYNPANGSVNGDFYRVVSVTQTPGANALSLELQTPLAKPVFNQVTVLDNVVEVFSRGTADSTKWEFRTER